MKCLRSDNGGEYTSGEFISFCLEKGIRRELTIPDTPQQNGIAERNWRTLFEMTRAMLKTANLSNKWWGRAIITAAYTKNRTLTKSNNEPITPEELFTGKRPNLKDMKIFGTDIYVHDPTSSKLDERAYKGIFLGYGEHVKGYIVFIHGDNRLIASRNVRFMEKVDKRGEKPTESVVTLDNHLEKPPKPNQQEESSDSEEELERGRDISAPSSPVRINDQLQNQITHQQMVQNKQIDHHQMQKKPGEYCRTKKNWIKKEI